MKTPDKIDAFITVITVVNYKSELIQEFLFRLNEMMPDNFVDYEILTIDIESASDAENLMSNILMKIPSIRYIKLAKNCDSGTAWLTGMQNAIGDFVVTVNIFDPLDKIPELVTLSRGGHDIVIGSAINQKKSMSYALVHNVARKIINNISRLNLISGTTNFNCFSRNAINAITKFSNKFSDLNVRIHSIGYPMTTFTYEVANKTLSKKKTVFIELQRGLSILISTSFRPLRWISAIGFFGSIIGMLMALYTLIVKIMFNGMPLGWASVAFMLSVFFVLTFIILFFISEYFNRLFIQIGIDQPSNIIYEKTSSVVVHSNKLNVANESK